MLLGIFLIAMIYSGLADRNTTVYTHADFLKWLENDEVQTVVVTPNEEVPTGHVKVALKKRGFIHRRKAAVCIAFPQCSEIGLLALAVCRQLFTALKPDRRQRKQHRAQQGENFPKQI